MTTSPELAALMTRGPAAAYSASPAFEPPRTAGIREPLRVKQLVPLLQPTNIGEASNAINENVITFFIFCAFCRPKSDLNQCGVTIRISTSIAPNRRAARNRMTPNATSSRNMTDNFRLLSILIPYRNLANYFYASIASFSLFFSFEIISFLIIASIAFVVVLAFLPTCRFSFRIGSVCKTVVTGNTGVERNALVLKTGVCCDN